MCAKGNCFERIRDEWSEKRGRRAKRGRDELTAKKAHIRSMPCVSRHKRAVRVIPISLKGKKVEQQHRGPMGESVRSRPRGSVGDTLDNCFLDVASHQIPTDSTNSQCCGAVGRRRAAHHWAKHVVEDRRRSPARIPATSHVSISVGHTGHTSVGTVRFESAETRVLLRKHSVESTSLHRTRAHNAEN